MKETKPHCQDCFDPFTQHELYHIAVKSTCGPNYCLPLCEKCTKKRGLDPKKEETYYSFNKRMSKYLGLK